MRKCSRYFILFFTCITLFSAIRGGLFFSYYLINPNHFISIFCENKYSVKEHCDGKCFLAKISSENTSEQNDFKFDFTKLQTEFFIIEFPTFKPFISGISDITPNFYYKYPIWESIPVKIQQPPII